jgi:hypothetical protein
MDAYSDLLPPVEYERPSREVKPARQERPPPYIPAPMSARPPMADQRVAGYPAPRPAAYQPPAPQSPQKQQVRPYTPPPAPGAERKRYLAGAQFVALLLLVSLVALTVMLPVMVGAVAIALAVVFRVGEYLFGDMVKRRQVRGSSAADPLLVLVGTPWALIKASLVSLVHVPLAIAFGACVWGVLRWGGGFSVNDAAAYAAGAFAAGLFVLPGGGAPRKAVTRTLTGVLRTPGAALAAAMVAGTIALFAVMFALGAETVWDPWRAPETVIKELTASARNSATGLITGLVDDLLKDLNLGFLSPWS